MTNRCGSSDGRREWLRLFPVAAQQSTAAISIAVAAAFARQRAVAHRLRQSGEARAPPVSSSAPPARVQSPLRRRAYSSSFIGDLRVNGLRLRRRAPYTRLAAVQQRASAFPAGLRVVGSKHFFSGSEPSSRDFYEFFEPGHALLEVQFISMMHFPSRTAVAVASTAPPQALW